MRVLFVGDVVASPGRKAVIKLVPDIVRENNIDYVIANAENVSHGRGVTQEDLTEMQEAGVNYFTSGDHLFWQRGTEDIIDTLPVIRPANYPKRVPGIGYKLLTVGNKGTILLINLIGRTFLNERLDDPFTKADEILSLYESNKPDYIIVDFHAESSSEKHALGFYLDGRVNAVVGSHTHVPTCDARVFPKGTLYVTDIGMTGNIDSVLGVKKEIILELYLTGLNQRFEWEYSGRNAFRSVLLDMKQNKIERLDLEI